MRAPRGNPLPALLGDAGECGVTLILWSYFTLGFLCFFLPFYLLAYLRGGDSELAFQGLNHRFYKIFLALLRLLTPRNSWEIAEQVRGIRSAIIICNHRSYLDPLLLIALFPRHKTIVKTRFFAIPLFGWFLRHSGYIPASGEGVYGETMREQIARLPQFLAGGGNLFIFPEGTRKGEGGAFTPGAFKLARLCPAPLQVVRIGGSERLFPPGRFRFNCRDKNQITVELRGTIAAGPGEAPLALAAAMARARTLLAPHP